MPRMTDADRKEVREQIAYWKKRHPRDNWPAAVANQELLLAELKRIEKSEAELLEALRWVERETHPEDGLSFERIHAHVCAAIARAEASR